MPSFFDGSSSLLQITRQTIQACMSLNFGKISSLTSALAALERLKIIINYCDHSSAFIFDWIFILAGNKNTHKTSDGFKRRPDRTLGCGVSYH